MLKKKLFYLLLIIIYILFLTKDNFLYLFSIKSINLDNVKESYYESEYHKLTKIMKLENNDLNIKYAKVILRDIYNFNSQITINAGSNVNLKKGSVVINELGVIGVVNKVYKNYSEVNLITNKTGNLSVKINDSYGILKNSDGLLVVNMVNLNKEIKKGDKVYTSGLTEIKENLLVGEVEAILLDNLELQYNIIIKPSVDFNKLNYVGVIE